MGYNEYVAMSLPSVQMHKVKEKRYIFIRITYFKFNPRLA